MHRALTTILVLALAALPLAAHGGQYKGPSDAGGASGGGGGSSGAPTNPGGAAAPGPGAPAASGPPSATGGRGGRTGRGRRERATTGTSQIEIVKGFEIWEFWWENNKDAFLNLKERLKEQGNVSGGAGFLTGRGRKAAAVSSRRPSVEMINTEVIPQLRTLLQNAENRDILDSTVLALGRMTREERAREIEQAIRPLLKHSELSVQSSATLSLGVLGSPGAIPVLQDLMADTSNGRQMVGGGEVHWLVQAFGALSLGLINDPEAVDSLIDVVENTPDTERDLKVTAIVALGLMDNERKPDIVEYMVGKLDDRALDATIASYVPTSLGKLGDPAAIGPLLEVFTDRDTDNYVRQSAAIGLGLLASMSDTEVVEALQDYIEEGRDEQTRHFAFISLGKIGARDEDPSARADAHEELVTMLGREIIKPNRQTHRSWAALAAALYGREHDGAQPELIERLSDAYDDEKDPSFKSAFAVSLGLLNAIGKAEDIYEDYKESKDQDFKGYASVALGLMNYTEAAEDLRQMCKSKSITPTFRLQTATGLGLMSDEEAVHVLIETLKGAQTLGVSSAVAKALGLIGDRSAIEPLKEIAADDDTTDLTRAFAVVALGIVGEKTDLPWNARISEDNNYRARVPAIDEVLDIL